ncbi:zinc-binding dehydrogenase [Paraburkholderia sp. RL17-337-BIB-A]|uniref:zinc-binding dehydrogenase n=1 Tax=Paraburkholderia sp. RL17-337-BIB-A TaxID=3031636 RepID=UPI0038B99B56
MKSTICTITGKEALQIEDVDRSRQLDNNELRIRTLYSLVSPGTELAIFLGEHVGLNDPNNTFAKYPFLSGYAAVGEVVETGPGVEQFSVGQKVYFEGYHESLAIVDAVRKNVRALPEGIDIKLAPFARLAQISYTALLVAPDAGQRSTVAVIGLGLIGNLAAQLFQIRGDKVIAADTVLARRNWAIEAGLHGVISTSGVDIAERVREAAADAEIDICVEATGNPAVVQVCLDNVRDRGRVILLGSPRGKIMIDVYNNIHRSGVSLIGAHERVLRAEAPGAPRMIQVVDEMLNNIAAGKLSVSPLVTQTARPDQLADCYQHLHKDRDQTLGVLIDWT